MIYLDTHAVVWMFQNEKSRFSNTAIELIASNPNELYISPMVILELDFLHEIGRIKNSGREIVDYLIHRIGLNVCKQSFHEIILQSLDFNWTRDPFDRIIMSQAKLNHALLITKDRLIRDHFKEAVW